MSAPIPNLMTVEQLAEHYGKAKKTIQNKLTRGWGPTPVTDPEHHAGAGLRGRGGGPF